MRFKSFHSLHSTPFKLDQMRFCALLYTGGRHTRKTIEPYNEEEEENVEDPRR